MIQEKEDRESPEAPGHYPVESPDDTPIGDE